MTQSAMLERCFPGRRAGLKREILGQALACFNEFGVEATTIDAIKTRCNTSVGAIYHHFGNKEGVLAALFFAAQDDQQAYLKPYLDTAGSLRDTVMALVTSYLDWVVDNPDWARFLYQARSAVAKGPHREELERRNAGNRGHLRQRLEALQSRQAELTVPFELLPSLIIGAAENYCRAWLSGRVATSPAEYRQTLSEAAWRAVGQPYS
ncbi:MAG: TetR/AcrR family transcriptional regulator [Pseudomonadota bacterium]|nr:TetR/AcrR family transcriptional regulator [Pseudomonadota bacterium]